MCTLIIATGVFGESGLFVIANRDEDLDRPAEAPSIHERGGMRILAPRDLKAGGTWLGLNAAGVFAGITNRFRLPSKPRHRSRGELPFHALQHSSARRSADAIAGLSAEDYNGFHLVMADDNEAFVVWNDTEELHREMLAPGYHVITERSFGAAPSQRLQRIRERLTDLGEWSDETSARLQNWMAEHDADNPLESTCVHLEERNYGTRSSTIVEIDDPWRFEHASGSPCNAQYRDFESELERL